MSEASVSGVIPHEPDEMGVWCEYDERIWLTRSRYPRRIDAIRFAMEQWRVTLPEVRCRSRWMHYTPETRGAYKDDPGWTEDFWTECDPATPGAFRVWLLESA